jgi:hypothetical protein
MVYDTGKELCFVFQISIAILWSPVVLKIFLCPVLFGMEFASGNNTKKEWLIVKLQIPIRSRCEVKMLKIECFTTKHAKGFVSKSEHNFEFHKMFLCITIAILQYLFALYLWQTLRSNISGCSSIQFQFTLKLFW